MRRSRRELSDEYLLANTGFDTAENEPCKVCPLSVCITDPPGFHCYSQSHRFCNYESVYCSIPSRVRGRGDSDDPGLRRSGFERLSVKAERVLLNVPIRR